jgi:hypothetical protein
MKTHRILFILLIACVVLLAGWQPALAQCAMCKASIENSTDVKAASDTLNLAAMVLLVPPVTIFAGLFAVFYRFRNVQGGTDQAEQTGED